MNEKDMNTAVAKLLEATARLEDSTSNLNKIINKMTTMVFMPTPICALGATRQVSSWTGTSTTSISCLFAGAMSTPVL